MPFEPIYGLPYEAANDLPGWSLTGGPDGDQPVLAERVAAQLRRLDDALQSLQDTFGIYPDLVQAGSGTVTPTVEVPNGFYNASYWRGTTSVVFDTPYPNPSIEPRVIVTAESTVPGILIECSVTNVSVTGFDIVIARSNTTTTGFAWIASDPT